MIIFRFWWFTRGEIPPLFVLLESSGRATPAAPWDVGRWWVQSGSVQVTSGAVLGGEAQLRSSEDCRQPSRCAALGTAGSFLVSHCLLLSHIPVAEMTYCGAGRQTSHQCCLTLSRPRANSLLKWLSYFSSSRGNTVAHRQCESLWSPLQQYLAFSRQQASAASCVGYKIRLASNFNLGLLPWLRRGKVFCSCLVEWERFTQHSCFPAHPLQIQA